MKCSEVMVEDKVIFVYKDFVIDFGKISKKGWLFLVKIDFGYGIVFIFFEDLL